MADFPLIRDVLTINGDVQNFYNSFSGAGPVFLLARIVQHEPNFVLKIKDHPLVIIADSYDGNGGSIDASGRVKNPNPSVRGADGVNGALCKFKTINGQTVPISAGGNGTPGRPGGSGSSGVDVTLFCRSGVRVNIDTSGTPSAPGGNGGHGGEGGNGWYGRMDDSGQIVGAFDGTHGGYGGGGGAGGSGGSAGVLTVLSVTPIASPILRSGGQPGSNGGRGGGYGRDGDLCPDPICTPDNQPCSSPDGAHGADGADPPIVFSTVSEEDYLQRVRTLLDSDPDRNFGNYWAPFRIAMGEYYFRQFQPDAAVDDGNGRLAAGEFAAGLQLQPDNPEALRLQQLLESGSNALGFPRDMDVVPDFQRYIGAFNTSAPLVLSFFNQGVSEILASQQLEAVRQLLLTQKKITADAVAGTKDDISYLQTEKQQATDEVSYLQQQLDKVSADIQAAMAAMQDQPFSLGSIIGTVAEIGAAVVSVIAAIPSGGASLVALVPAVVSFASEVVDHGTPIVNAVFAGEKPDTDAVEAAYKKVDKDIKAVVTAGKAIANFVTVVQKISAGKTASNAQSVELVKQGAELTHQLLIAKNQVYLKELKSDALQARLTRTQGILDSITTAESGLENDAVTIRATGVQAINAALSYVDTLLSFAFFAQRSLEIYTLTEPTRTLALDAGSVNPQTLRTYVDGFPNMATVVVQAYQAAWAKLLRPIDLQQAYLQYLQRGVDTDIVRLSFSEATDAALLNSLRTTRTMPFRLDADSLSANGREAKIRGVAVAFIGATSPSSLISCVVEHGNRYEQIGPDGKLVVQLLEPKSDTVTAPITALMQDGVAFGSDQPIDAPQSLSIWGRGVGGDWVLRLPESQPHGEAIDLSGLKTIQIWIGYQFVAGS